MADVMVAAMPFHGHAGPLAAVAGAFVADGHRVRAYTGAAYESAFSAVGADVIHWRSARDFDEHDPSGSYPELAGRRGPRQMLANVEHLFVRSGAGQCADLLEAWRVRPWDAVVADATSLGAAFAAERTGTAWVSVSTTPLALPSRRLPPPGLGIAPARNAAERVRDAALRRAARSATRGIQRAYRDERTRAGLGPGTARFDEATASPDLVCAVGVPELEYPREDPTGRIVFVGELASRSPTPGPFPALPEWWSEVVRSAVPVVHVTQGTQNLDPSDLIAPTFAALGRQPVLVVATTGRPDDAPLPFPTPPNARVAGFVPHAALLPHVDVMITNGGWGGVLAALAHGVPLVVAGGDLDKPEAAARVAWAGAGIDLRTGRPRPRAILDARRRVSRDAAIRGRSRELAARFAEHDGPAEVVAHTLALIERVRARDRG